VAPSLVSSAKSRQNSATCTHCTGWRGRHCRTRRSAIAEKAPCIRVRVWVPDPCPCLNPIRTRIQTGLGTESAADSDLDPDSHPDAWRFFTIAIAERLVDASQYAPQRYALSS